MNEISNTENTLDVRDIIARVEHLETELTDAWEGEGNSERVTLPEWLANASADDAHTLQDAATEYLMLSGLLEDLCGGGGDEQWRGDWYPVTMIRDSFFEDYAEELAEDIGAINKEAAWPLSFIDWEAAADALKIDYSTVEYDGVTYWYR